MKKFLFLFLLLTLSCDSLEPWFTGPLLTPSGKVVKKGHYNIEPYILWTVNNGVYDEHWKVHKTEKFYQLSPLVQYKFGIYEKVDFAGTIQVNYNETQGKRSWQFCDLPIGFDYQLYNGKTTYLKFTFQELFPTGKYQHLKPKKLKTDVGGLGSYISFFALTFSQLFKFHNSHYLSWRFNVALGIPSSVRVRGINTYGGDPTTKGRVSLGTIYQLLTSLEYSLTQNWVLAVDFQLSANGKNRFKGRTIDPMGNRELVNISLAPAIEYNFNDSIGIIVGSWFSVAGKNCARFVNASAAVNISY